MEIDGIKRLTQVAKGFAAIALLSFGAHQANAANIIIALNIVSAGGGATYTTSGGSFNIAQLVYNSVDDNITASEYPVLSFTVGASPTLTLTNVATGTSFFSGVADAQQMYNTVSTAPDDFSLIGTDTIGAGGSLSLTASQIGGEALNTAFFNDIVATYSLGTINNDWIISGGVSGSDIAGTNKILSDTLELTNLPEPSSTVLMLAGLAAIAAILRKRRLSHA